MQESITPSTGGPHPSTFTSPVTAASPAPAPDQDERESSTDSDEDFVYDVYYREVRPAGPSAGPAAAALASEAVGKDAGGAGGWDVGSLDGLKRIGQLCVARLLLLPATEQGWAVHQDGVDLTALHGPDKGTHACSVLSQRGIGRR